MIRAKDLLPDNISALFHEFRLRLREKISTDSVNMLRFFHFVSLEIHEKSLESLSGSKSKEDDSAGDCDDPDHCNVTFECKVDAGDALLDRIKEGDA